MMKDWKKGKELDWTTFINKKDTSYKIRIEGDNESGFIIILWNKGYNYQKESLGEFKTKTRALQVAREYMRTH